MSKSKKLYPDICPICGKKCIGQIGPCQFDKDKDKHILYIHEEQMEDWNGLLYLRGVRGCDTNGEIVNTLKDNWKG